MANDKTTKSGSPNKTTSNADLSSVVASELQAINDRDFLQETVLGMFEAIGRNKGIVATVVGLLILGGLGIIGWDMVKDRKERSAQEALYSVEKDYNSKREKFEQAKFAELSGQMDAKKLEELFKTGSAVKASGDLAKDYGNLITDLEAFANKHSGTTAGAQAALLAADTLMTYNQAEKAGQVLQASVQKTKASSLVGVLTRMANGNAWAQAGKCDVAIRSWEEVLASKDFAFLHGEAALRSGLCLEKAGDKAKAIEMYRKASAESERSSASQTAKTLLRALELGT